MIRLPRSSSSEALARALTAALLGLPASEALADEPRVELLAHVGYANAGSKPVASYDFAVQAVPYADIANGRVTPFRSGPAAELAVGWRVTPAFSVGGSLGFRVSGVDPSVSLGTETNLSRAAWTFGGYVRYSPVLQAKWLQPWVSVGLGLAIDSESVLFFSEGGSEQTTVRNFGLAIPIQAGIGFRVVPALSVGPLACFSPVIGMVANDSSSSSGHIDAKTYGVWLLGLEARVVAF